MIVQFEILTTQYRNGVKEIVSSGLLDSDQLGARLPHQYLYSDIFSGRIYDGADETIVLNDSLSLRILCHAENPPLSMEEFDAVFQDVDVRIEAADAQSPTRDRFQVTILPDDLVFIVDLSFEVPRVYSEMSNEGKPLRTGTDFGDYAEFALDKAEAYRDQLLQNS